MTKRPSNVIKDSSLAPFRRAWPVDAGICAQPPRIAPVMMAKEVRRDPEQPRSGVRARSVETSPEIERPGEGFGREVVSQVGADATSEIAVDRVVVSVEDGREHVRLRPRSGDDLRVRPCLH